MSVPREISERAEAIILVAGVASWSFSGSYSLCVVPHPAIPRPPWRISRIQVVAMVGRISSLLPFILP